MADVLRLDANHLKRFCREVYVHMGLTQEDADLSTDVLIEADIRGIPTHGVRLLPRHVEYIQKGIIIPTAKVETLRETPTTLTVDAHHAMGPAVSSKIMSALIRKAETMGTAFASVRNSTHFGIAGYYSTMALEKNMIGIAMTNANPVGLPTFGSKGMYGTNPLAVAAPAGQEVDFALDMATTVITNGKIETYEIQNKPLPPGWAVDKNFQPATDAREIERGLVSGNHFILPLGGQNEDFSGHKGYNLAVLVDILSAALSGGALGPETRYHPWNAYPGALLSHFFGAINIAAFRDPADFRSDMDRMLGRLRECPPAPGQKRVYYAGLKEYEHAKECKQQGIPLTTTTYESLCALGKEMSIQPPKTL